MLPSGLAPGDVLERARAGTDVVEVEECLQEVLVVEVVVPELRRDALSLKGWGTVYQRSTYESFDHMWR